jgi:hypothetical protein
LFLPCLCLLFLLLRAIQHKELIVTLSTFALCSHNQSYCWRFAPLQSSMWLIHIDEKGWLSQAQSHTLVAINRHPCSLQYDKNNIIVVIASCNTTLNIDHPMSRMLSALQCISSQALCSFAIIPCSLAMRHKKLVGCCMAQCQVPLSQSTIIVVALCNTTSTLIAIILAINIACCCHPCNQQHMYYLIVVSLRLALVDLLLSHTQHQQHICHRFSCDTALKIDCCHCFLQYKLVAMIIVIDSI